jgi:protein-disulfide isomerase
MRFALKTLTVTALLLAAPQVAAETPVSWDGLSSATPEGHPVLGNQAAPVRLVEFISYTCGHCAHYDGEAKAPLRSGLVRQGKVAVEVRPFFRNSLDVTATLLALCGTENRFFTNHDAILGAQDKWLRQPENPDAKARWANPDFAARMKAVAEDLGLYQIMLDQGFQPAELDQCLADQDLANSLAEATELAMSETGVTGTPSFLINGKLQTVHGWDELRPRLERAVRKANSVVEKP